MSILKEEDDGGDGLMDVKVEDLNDVDNVEDGGGGGMDFKVEDLMDVKVEDGGGGGDGGLAPVIVGKVIPVGNVFPVKKRTFQLVKNVGKYVPSSVYIGATPKMCHPKSVQPARD